MKKVLSFVLVLAMILGSVSMAFAFTDDAAITNEEASKVLAAAGILEGYTDGSFKPTGILTRAEGAAIAARMLLGKTEAAKLTTVVSPFNDVPATHWAAGYVSYCVAQGLLNGYGNGNFGPDDTLSVAAFGKMMLTALGYKSENEGFIGDAWETNVGSIMVKAGLTDGLTITGTNSCSREVAAQVALNTLKATMVKYTGTATTVSTGNVTVTTGYSPAEKQNWLSDAQSGDKQNYLSDDYGTPLTCPVRFMNRYQSKLERTADAADDFMRPATYKWNYDGKKAYEKTSTTDLIATYTTKQTRKALYTLLNERGALGTNYGLKVYRNGADVTTDAAVLGAGANTTSGAVAALKGYKNNTDSIFGNGTQIEVYFNSANKMTTIVGYDYYLVQATADYNTNKDQVNVKSISKDINITRISKDDVASVTSVKEDDYLVVTALAASTNVAKSAVPATKVTGSISGYTETKDITVDGTKYTVSGSWNTAAGQQGTAFQDLSAGTSLTLVLDPNSFVLATTDEVSSSQYMYIASAAQENAQLEGDYKAIAYFTDGTRQTITLDGSTEFNKYTANGGAGWYNYSVKKNGNYTISTLAGVEALKTTVQAINKGKIAYVSSPSAGTFANANNETVFLVRKSGKNTATVYTGYKNVPGSSGAGNFYAAAVEKNSYAKYVFLESGAFTAAETSDYVLVYKAGAVSKLTNTDGDKYFSYNKTFLNGEEKEIELSDGVTGGIVAGSNAVVGLWKEVGYDVDGRIDNVAAVALQTGVTIDNVDGFGALTGASVTAASVSYKSGVLTIDAKNTFSVTDGAKAYIYDGNTIDEVSFSNISANMDDVAPATYTVFVKFAETDANKTNVSLIWFVKNN